MKHRKPLFMLLVFLILTGCVQQKSKIQVITGVISQTGISSPADLQLVNQITQGIIASGINISGAIYNISISGGKLVYDGFFSVDIPRDLIGREYNNAAIERLSLSDVARKKHLTITVTSANGRRENQNDKDKCTFEKYEESVISKKITTTLKGEQTLYVSSLIFSAFGETREAGNICFIKNDFIYSIEIGNYTKQYIQSVIDSLTFLN